MTIKREAWVVIETYPDGGTWTHVFLSKQDAEWAIEDMKAAHAGRGYEMSELQR